MSWAEMSEKFRDCAALVLSRAKATAVIQLVRGLPQQQSLAPLLRALVPDAEKPARKTQPRKVREQTMESYSETLGNFVDGLDLESSAATR